MPRNLWSRDELTLALSLYLKLPFGKLHSRTPEIIHLAGLLGRTPGSIAMWLNNFANVDPYPQKRGIGGLPGGRKQVEPIWNEFINHREQLLFESEKILAAKEQNTIENKFVETLRGTKHMKGEYKLREVKTRVNQYVFRQMVVANYDGQCAITGINIPDLLLASHIVPWAKNEQERLNPENGTCFSPLCDRAYDKGYISISEKYEVLISTDLKKKSKEEFYSKHFGNIAGSKMHLPKKYLPKKNFYSFT